jgi:hypothetical protein
MSCKLDVRKAILDAAIKEVADGRYSFTRMGEDVIRINNAADNRKTKVKSNAQAYAIAREVIDRTQRSFNGMVSGYISQASAYDPAFVFFTVHPSYIEHEYAKLTDTSKTDPGYTQGQLFHPSVEREFINSSTGPVSYPNILFFPSMAEAGKFTRFIQFKKNQLYGYQQRLNKIEKERKKVDITTQRLNELNKEEKDIRLQVEGSLELDIKGIEQEILELEAAAEIESVAYYAERDLSRLEILAASHNIEDLKEAQRIIDFYTLAGTFQRNVENPFFEQEDIFLEDQDGNLTTGYKLSDESRQKFMSWRDRAIVHQNEIDKRKEEITVAMVNDNSSVKNTYNKEFTFQELTRDEEGLKDTDWISMWTMDVTQGLLSHNGILPQVMFSHLANNFEKKRAWARDIEERVDQLSPKVQDELKKIPGQTLGGVGILGLSGVSFNLYKEKTKEGRETGGLIQRFVKEFFDEESSAKHKFREAFDKARIEQEPQARANKFNKAFEDLKKWRRANTLIFEVHKVPEILAEAEFAAVIGASAAGEAQTYRTKMVSILGEKGYKEQVAAQKKLLRKYISEKQSVLDTLLTMENKDRFDELSDKAKNSFQHWEHNHSPMSAIDDYYNVAGIFFNNRKSSSFMDYSVFIPRKHTVNITQNNGQYEFADTTEVTNYYNQDFQTIEANPALSQFYDLVKEVCETIREQMPYELQQKLPVNSIPAMMKTSAEILADKNMGRLKSTFAALGHLWERLRLSFGVVKQAELSYATIDPITGRANYKINDAFLQGNSRAVKERMLIEKTKFIQAFNHGLPPDERLAAVRRFTTLPFSRLNKQALILLAQYTGVNLSMADITAGKLDALKAVTGEQVEIGKFIRDFSVHSVVQSQSFDLPKVLKYFSNMTMAYAAREESLPFLEIVKQHYESIQKPETNNLGKGIFNIPEDKYMKGGLRTNAIKQMEDWFDRVVLDNYGTKHTGVHGFNGPTKRWVDKAKNWYAKDIYSDEEKQKIKEIDELLKTETDDKKRKELEKIKEAMGKVRTATALFDNLLAWIRTMRLGYNLSSGITNFMEGFTSNMVLAASSEYFDPQEIYYAYTVAKWSFAKNSTFGLAEHPRAKKARSLMDKFNVIMDSKNELQKSSQKTYASKFSFLNPHELNQRVEYLNQSPVMIAMLRTLKITGVNNEQSSVWDAMDKHGHLKPEFKTEENIENWEKMTGEQYLNFKQKLHKAIVLGHGNYDELRGMMAKSSTAGKALMMFKTWIPNAFYWRFAVEQDDIQAGTQGFKGRYWSFGKGSGALYGAMVGTTIFGPIGSLVGLGVGAGLGAAFGVDTGVNMLKESIHTTQALVKKVLGMPINLLTGKQIIGGNEDFNNFVGKGGFTEQDAKNMRANITDISLQLAWLAMTLMVKSIFWDDDEEDMPDGLTELEKRKWEDEQHRKRTIHNIAVNKLVSLSNQATMYINPVNAWESTLGSLAVKQYLVDVGKEIVRIGKWLDGEDKIGSGYNAGESGLMLQSAKTFMPGIFKDDMLGFGTQADKVFEESPFHKYFESESHRDSKINKGERAARRRELEAEGYEDTDIRKILNEELPTTGKLQKLDLSREEYEQEYLEDYVAPDEQANQ